MESQITLISLLPVVVLAALAVIILFKHKIIAWYNVYAYLRMVAQLTLVGYILSYIFTSDSIPLVMIVLLIMLSLSSFIGMRTLAKKSVLTYFLVLVAIFLGGGFSLFFLTQLVLHIKPWYDPSKLIPLAGMVFFNALNAISLAIDRFLGELKNNNTLVDAERIALKTSIIPMTNSYLSAGIVSIPGLMTGQILAGVSPLIAVRYQIAILSTLFFTQVSSVCIFLILYKRYLKKQNQLQEHNE